MDCGGNCEQVMQMVNLASQRLAAIQHALSPDDIFSKRGRSARLLR